MVNITKLIGKYCEDKGISYYDMTKDQKQDLYIKALLELYCELENKYEKLSQKRTIFDYSPQVKV